MINKDDINELGKKGPYFKYITFPVEVTIKYGLPYKEKTMRYKKLDKDAKLIQPNEGDAGYDLCSNEDITIYSSVSNTIAPLFSTVIKINTNIAVEIPPGYVGLIRDRSSIGAKGVIVCGGVIDSQYRGPLIVCLSNTGGETVEIKKGDKIAQLLIVPCITPILEEVEGLNDTERGSDGFGSTGK